MRKEKEGKVGGPESGLRREHPRVAILQKQKLRVMRSSTVRLCTWATEGKQRALEKKQRSSMHIDSAWVVAAGGPDWK